MILPTTPWYERLGIFLVALLWWLLGFVCIVLFVHDVMETQQ